MSKETKKDKLLQWVRAAGIVSSVQVTSWGLKNYYISSVREIRKLAEIGQQIRRIPDEEVVLSGLIKKGNKKIAFWEAI